MKQKKTQAALAPRNKERLLLHGGMIAVAAAVITYALDRIEVPTMKGTALMMFGGIIGLGLFYFSASNRIQNTPEAFFVLKVLHGFGYYCWFDGLWHFVAGFDVMWAWLVTFTLGLGIIAVHVFVLERPNEP